MLGKFCVTLPLCQKFLYLLLDISSNYIISTCESSPLVTFFICLIGSMQEMMGLTYFMLDQSRKEAEYCMENAFNTYLVCVFFLASSLILQYEEKSYFIIVDKSSLVHFALFKMIHRQLIYRPCNLAEKGCLVY